MAGRRPDGALERDILRVLWDAKEPLTPAVVNERLGGALAYTTVMTVLTRLHKKDLLNRSLQGRAYLYGPALSESDYAARRMATALDAASDHASVLAGFVNGLSARDAQHLRRVLDRAQDAAP